MTKISKKSAYPIKNPIVGDYFVGTDSENNGKTVNFGFEYAANLINRVNGTLLINYKFVTDFNTDLAVLTDGVFVSSGNETVIDLVTQLKLNKKNFQEDDLSDLFLFIKDNVGDFNIKLQNSSNLLNAIYLKISSVVNYSDYFVFNVVVYKSNTALTNLIGSNVYFFSFEINEKGDIGSTGPQGIQGIKGDKGEAGATEDISGKVDGSGTTNKLAKFTASGQIGDSQIVDNGNTILIGAETDNGLDKLQVNGSTFSSLGYKTEKGISVKATANAFGNYNNASESGIITEIPNDSNAYYIASGRNTNGTFNAGIQVFGQGNYLRLQAGIYTAALNQIGFVTDKTLLGDLNNYQYSNEKLWVGGITKLFGTTLINTNANNGLDTLQVNGTISALPGVLDNQVVVKSQLDSKAPLSGSSNYIRSSVSSVQQGGFNISGQGFFGDSVQATKNITINGKPDEGANLRIRANSTDSVIPDTFVYSNLSNSGNSIFSQNITHDDSVYRYDKSGRGVSIRMNWGGIKFNTFSNGVAGDVALEDTILELFNSKTAVFNGPVRFSTLAGTTTRRLLIASNGAITAGPTDYTSENVANKQNTLVVDGTGLRYATVDAIRADALLLSENQTVTGIKSFLNRLLVGTTTDNGVDALQVNGSTNLKGNTTINGILDITPSITASSAMARGANLKPTLSASANNDVLVGLDINSTFSNGTFTGVSNIGLRVLSGFVQIGTLPSGPSAPLHVSGTIRIADPNSANSGSEIKQNGSTLEIRAGSSGGGNIKLINGGNPYSADQFTSTMILNMFGGNSYSGWIYSGGRPILYAHSNGIGLSVSSSGPAIFVSPNNNVLIGGTTDNGIDKLQVNGSSYFNGDLTLYNGSDSVRLYRGAGAAGRLIISRPGGTSIESVSFGGGNDEIRIRGLGSIRHTGADFQFGNSGGGRLIFDAATGQLVFRGSGNQPGLTMFPITKNILLQDGGTIEDLGYRLDINGTFRAQGNSYLNTTLLGTTVDNGIDRLQVQGSTSLNGRLNATGDVKIGNKLIFNDGTAGVDSKYIISNPGSNDVTMFNTHLIVGYSIGLRGNRGSSLGLESTGSDLNIAAGNSTRITIKGAGGNVLVGTTVDNGIDAFQVSGSASFTSNITARDALFSNVGIGTGSGAITAKLHVNGRLLIVSDGETATFGNLNYSTKYLQVRDGSNYAVRWGLQANNNITNSGTALMTSSKTISFKANAGGTSFENIVDPDLIINSDFIGIGTANPLTHGGTAKLSVVITNTEPIVYGRSSTDAIFLRRLNTGNYQFQTTANGGNTGNLFLQPYGGNVLISTTVDNGIDQLQVNGSASFSSSVKVGDNTVAASSANAGSMRYRETANGSFSEMSMRTGSMTFAWVTQTSNNF